jgi:hypothetical protein
VFQVIVGNGHPMVTAGASMSRAVAVAWCQAAKHARGQGLRIPRDAKQLITVIAYDDID